MISKIKHSPAFDGKVAMVILFILVNFISCDFLGEFDSDVKKINDDKLGKHGFQNVSELGELYLDFEENSEILFGPEIITMDNGVPHVYEFEINPELFQHFEGPFVMYLKNGDGSKETRATSATIKVDGEILFAPHYFNKQVSSVLMPVELTENTKIEAWIEDTPSSFIEIKIMGKMCPHQITWEVMTIPNSELLDNGTSPSLFNGEIAWHDGTYNGALYYWDGSNTTQVGTGCFGGDIDLFDGTIMYRHNEGVNNGVRIYYWDGTSTINVSGDLWGDHASLYDGSIAFSGYAEGHNELYLWDGTSITQLTNGSSGTPIPSLYENTIAWIDAGVLYYNNGTDVQIICDSKFVDWSPSLFNGQIAYSAREVGEDLEIYLWNGSESIQITDNNVDDINPSLFDGTIAWSSKFNIDWDSNEIMFWDGCQHYQLTDNELPDVHPSNYNGNIAWCSGSGSGAEIMYAYRTDIVE
jgi:hypothetical protein